MIVGYYINVLKEKHKSKQGLLGLQTKCKQDHNNTASFTDIGHRQGGGKKSLIRLVPYRTGPLHSHE